MIKIQYKTNCSRETISYLNSFEIQIAEVIKTILRKEEYSNLVVKCGIILEEAKKNEDPFSLKSNASMAISMSNKFIGELHSFLENKTIELNSCLDKNTTIRIEIIFSEKKGQTSKENDEQTSFFPTVPRYSFEQVILPQDVYNEIFEAINLLKYQTLIYEVWGFKNVDPLPKSVINFYGPPGTGKTMCAHAVDYELGKKLLALNYAEIESKYVGDAAKNLTNAFDTAKKYDCILFFDEADSFLGKRIKNVTQGAEQALNSLRSQMLILLEEFSGIVIFATNLVSNFDQAFESRILKHIQFSLPNEEARVAILKKMIPKELPLQKELTEEEYKDLSIILDGLSGREIKGAILECLLRKATQVGKGSVFSIDDFTNAFKQKQESLKKLAEEKTKNKKEKIIKALTEGNMKDKENLESTNEVDESRIKEGDKTTESV